MSGERNLAILLQSLNPELDPEDYVFCSIQSEDDAGLLRDAWAMIREREGVTLILRRDTADRLHLPYDGLFRRITLSVHSSLEAVGLTAAVSSRLAERNISANVVAGYYHDHVFVPSGDAKQALEAIEKLNGASQD
ncbi:MAG: ACT domain-containing protein [Spirochaetaceae bacterium]|nr:MAG: ACT domain-containing protein [Spirochaetaceae bacterium]